MMSMSFENVEEKCVETQVSLSVELPVEIFELGSRRGGRGRKKGEVVA